MFGPFGPGPTVGGMFTHAHISRRLGRIATLAALLALASSPVSSTTTATPATVEARGEDATAARSVAACALGDQLALPPAIYGWPGKPFFRQHPVRGFFGDPRLEETFRGNNPGSFHFGVDVSAANGAPVYATISGDVVLEPERPETVAILGDDGRSVFAYWHVVPSVRNGVRAVAYRTVVGHVRKPWAHVHFAELRDGRYMNPLRPGAMGPYEDATCPSARNLRLEQSGSAVDPQRARGRVDLVVEAQDEHPLPVPAPWTDKPVTPSLITWRLTRDGRPVMAWRTAFDVRLTLPDQPFPSVYARWTRQNHPWRNGRYRFYLAHGLDTALLAGADGVEVRAADTAGNTARARFSLSVGNV